MRIVDMLQNNTMRILFGLCLIFAGVLPPSGSTAEIYRAYDGAPLPDFRVAILEAFEGTITYKVDGFERKLHFRWPLDYDWIHLLPGAYRIERLPTPAYGNARFDAHLKAGHTYGFEYHKCVGCNPDKFYGWLEDSESKEILGGNFPAHKFDEHRSRELARVVRVLHERFDAVSDAAQRCETTAQYQLGTYYLSGIHPILAPDIPVAYVWFTLAEMNGYAGDGSVKARIALDMTTQALAKAREKIAEMSSCRGKSAAQNQSRR